MAEGASPKRRLWRRVAFGLVWVFVVINVAAFFVTEPGRRGRLPDVSSTPSPSRLDARFGQVASVLAHRGVTALCWSQEDWGREAAERGRPSHTKLGGHWAAFTSFSPSLAVELSPEVCIELSRLLHLGGPVQEDKWRDALALSVGVLAHESMHAAGYLSETRAECWGMQSIPAAAVELGRSREEGQYLAELYWRRFYRFRHPPYRSSECRNGASLDLNPSTDHWP